MPLSGAFRFSWKFLSVPFLSGTGSCIKPSLFRPAEVFWLSALFRAVGAESPVEPDPSLRSSRIQMLKKLMQNFNCFLLNLHSGTFCIAWSEVNFVPCVLVSGLALDEKSWSTWRIKLGRKGGVMERVKRICWLLLLGDH